MPHAAWVEIVPVPQQTGVDAVPAQSMGARQLKGVLVVAHAAAVPQVEVPDAGTQQVWPAVHVIAGVPLDDFPHLAHWLHRCIERPAAADWKPISFRVPRPEGLGLLAMFV